MMEVIEISTALIIRVTLREGFKNKKEIVEYSN